MHYLGNNWNNYKEPNVWQSGAQGILLGVLGGSGCCQIGNILCGGGYGGYGYGGYGYGGYGYGGYGYGGFGRIMSDEEFGAYAGVTVACLGMRAGATAIKNNKAKNAQITKLNEEITKIQDKINNPQNYVKAADTAVENAITAQTIAGQKKDACDNAVVSTKASYDKLTAEADKLKITTPLSEEQEKRLKALGDDTTGEIKAAKDKYDKAVEEQEKAEKALTAAQDKVEAEEAKRQQAINKVVTDATEELDKKLEELEELQGNKSAKKGNRSKSDIETLKEKNKPMIDFKNAIEAYKKIKYKRGADESAIAQAKQELIDAYGKIDNTSSSKKFAKEQCAQLGVTVS